MICHFYKVVTTYTLLAGAVIPASINGENYNLATRFLTRKDRNSILFTSPQLLIPISSSHTHVHNVFQLLTCNQASFVCKSIPDVWRQQTDASHSSGFAFQKKRGKRKRKRIHIHLLNAIGQRLAIHYPMHNWYIRAHCTSSQQVKTLRRTVTAIVRGRNIMDPQD